MKIDHVALYCLDLEGMKEFFIRYFNGVPNEMYHNPKTGLRTFILSFVDSNASLGFRILQFNAVVATNVHALHLYERLGFTQLGIIPQGFRMKDGHYEDIIPHYIEL